MPRLLIAASGTGGHIFPALAVAEALSEEWEVIWLGVPDRMEIKLVPSCYRLQTIRVGGLQARGFRRFVQFFKLFLAAGRVRSLLKQEGIDAIFTTGGYIAVPSILGAMWCRLPVILHESNAFPGRATRLLAAFCEVVAIGFPPAEEHLPFGKILKTGTPVRTSFFSPHALPDWVPNGAGPLLVVIGGSQGAVGLNRMVRAVLPEFLKEGCRVVHLTGENDPDFDKIQHPNLVEKLFSDQMPALLQHADIAISRAGAVSLCELAACKTPAILVPYPQAADNHQDANASFAAGLGAAVIVHQHKAEDSVLRDTLWRLLKSSLRINEYSHDWLIDMKTGMENLAEKSANMKLVELIERFKQDSS